MLLQGGIELFRQDSVIGKIIFNLVNDDFFGKDILQGGEVPGISLGVFDGNFILFCFEEKTGLASGPQRNVVLF
jgi:hypothetical protein